MIIRNVFLFFSFLLVCSVNGQEKEIDSLLKTINLVENDENEIKKMLSSIVKSYNETDLQGMKEPQDSAMVMQERLNYSKLLGLAFKKKSHILYLEGNMQNAIILADSAIALFKKLRDTSELGNAYYQKGTVLFGKSEIKESNTYYQKAIEQFTSINDSLSLAKVYKSLGVNEMYKSNYNGSLKFYLKALKIIETLDETNSLEHANLLNNMGILYYKLQDYDKALDHHHKALNYFETIGNKENMAHALNSIGNVHDDLNQSKLAIEFYNKSYDLMRDINNQRGIAAASTNIGIVSFSLKDYGTTIEVMKKAIPIYKNFQDMNNLSVVYLYLGNSYTKLFEQNKNRSYLTSAKKNYKKSIECSETVGNIMRKSRALFYLGYVNQLSGEFSEAVKTLGTVVELADSVIPVTSFAELGRLEERHKAELQEARLIAKNEKEQALAQAEIENQKRLGKVYLFAGLGLLFMAGLGIFLYLRKNRAVRLKEQAEFETKVADTELKALRAQMNPHFIFNSLNSINSFMLKNDKKASSEYLRKFAGLMRKTLDSSNKKEVVLKEDLELLTSYFEMEAKRLPNKFDYHFRVDKTIDLENTMVPPLIMQPFIENSIWHGIAEKEGKGEISVEVKDRKDTILYIVDDNGVGLSTEEKPSKEKSMGIQLTKNRLAIINATKNKKDNVRVIEKNQGLRVEVEIPLNLAF